MGELCGEGGEGGGKGGWRLGGGEGGARPPGERRCRRGSGGAEAVNEDGEP